jgi:hypothetical protein
VLQQAKGLDFRSPQFSDVSFEFLVRDGQVTALRQRSPGAEFTFPKK